MCLSQPRTVLRSPCGRLYGLARAAPGPASSLRLAQGDRHEGTGLSVYELNAVLGATTLYIDEVSANVEGGIFTPSEAMYAIAATSDNVPTDFTASPSDPVQALN